MNTYKKYLSKHLLLSKTSCCLFTQYTNKIYPLNNQMVVTDITCGLLILRVLHIWFYVYMMNLFVVRIPLQTYSTNNFSQTPKTDTKRFFLYTYDVPFYLHLYMYMFNPNKVPSPICDNLIMFLLAKVIYQNVLQKTSCCKDFNI